MKKEEKLVKGGRAYFIDFRGKVKSGHIYSLTEEKIGIMGLGTVSITIAFPSKDAALKDRSDKEKMEIVRKEKTFPSEFEPCILCRHHKNDFCDAFCISKTEDDYYHECFAKKRKLKKESL